MFYVFWQIAVEGRRRAKYLGSDVYKVYMLCGVLTLFLWLLYPVAWGLCEGGNYISSDAEAIFYSTLDFCAKPVFSICLIAGHWNINPARMGLKIRDGEDMTQLDQYREKPAIGDRHDRAIGAATAQSTANNGGVTNGSNSARGRLDVGSSHHRHADGSEHHTGTVHDDTTV